MNTPQTQTAPHRHPRRATMGDDWQIGFSPRRPAPAPQPAPAPAPSPDLGAWFSRLLGLETGAPAREGTRQPSVPAHVGR